MCGIAGIFRCGGALPIDLEAVRRMNEIHRRRGPDDEGTFQEGPCVLGHRRLAIIDLSPLGHQPFLSADGRYALVFNGEIYNYIELRGELEARGRVFATKTDTEVLLAAYAEYGRDCLDRLNGMFAFAVYDRLEGSLFLARDRFGIKPLYYAEEGGALFFASEIKALRAVLQAKPRLNSLSLFDFLVFNRTDVWDETFFTDVRRLPKGSFARLDRTGLKVETWWSPMRFLGAHADETPETAAKTVRALLESAVALRMRSDVPVGSCLSGGLDSSILLGVLFSRCGAGKDFSAFTASFPDHPLDETPLVAALREKYPFTSHLTFPSPQGALEHLRDFVHVNDEPTMSFSYYAQYEVMRLAKERGVVVLLDGQGGDESFAGYQYFHGFNLASLFRSDLSAFFRECFAIMSRRQSASAYATFLFQLLPPAGRKALLRRKAPWLRRDFFEEHVEKSLIFSRFFDAEDVNVSLARHFQYKLEHLLRMEDRNSMAFSLEARVPYLDYRLVEYILGLPSAFKIGGGETKKLQKAALGDYALPEILARRDKTGFGPSGFDWKASEGWRRRCEQSRDELAAAFPAAFCPDFAFPGNPGEAWKLNQLAIWQEIFLDEAVDIGVGLSY